MKAVLSVVIVAKNEEERIAQCLESVMWADEIIVVDDNSTDKTPEIARRYTDRIFNRPMDVEGKHRNWAYSLARNEWVLSLDADERVSEELRDEFTALFKNGFKYDGYAIPRRNYIGNYWVRYGGWYPSAQMKLFKKDLFRWEEVSVHPRAIFDRPAGILKSDIIHYSYKDFGDFLNKLNRQTTLEAKKWLSDKRKMTLGKALWRSLDRFFRTYIGKRGYKDGFIGFMLAFYAGFYQLVSFAKYWEDKNKL